MCFCVLTLVTEFWVEFGVSSFEIFGEDACLANRGHEVGVAGPAWEHVNVHVLRDACAGCGPEVHAHVEAGRRVNITQGRLRSFGQVHHLICDLFRRRIELARVQVRNDHHVSRDIRVKIQDNKTVLGAMQYEVGFVVVRVGGDPAKHTALGL
jgi:hypothetical protein